MSIAMRKSMSDEIRYYKGKHKVRVLSRSLGNWTIEALEHFKDTIRDQTMTVKQGERRIVKPNLLFKRKALPSPIKEHTYELEMEKKLKHLI